MADQIRWLRLSFWVGAVVDALAAVQMLYPPLFGFGMGLSGFDPGFDYRYAMGMGASLMLGWSVLLIWADRKPMERMGVLPLTVFPVIVGIAANELWGVLVGFAPVRVVLPIWALQLGLSILFIWSYWRARSVPSATAAYVAAPPP
jgi:hypothetical protein